MSTIIVVAPAAKYSPPPVASPMAATVHNPAAVVTPLTAPFLRKRIVPAPIKPIQLTTCAATLEGSKPICSKCKTSAKP